VSGRAVKNLRDKVGLDGVVYAGNHGAEYIVDGQHTTAPGAAEYRDKIMRVFDHIKAATSDPGMVWDDKLLSATIHFRLSKDRERARRQLEAALRSAPGVGELEVFWGNLVLEIRAPIGLNKGYAVEKLARDYGLDSVMFLGDDTTDVDAMVAVRAMSRQGRIHGVGVVVIHEASPRALIEAADYRLDSVAQVAEFLGWLDSAVG
ncbi:MAG: trehalose-phosphatase, partial [Chloroflexi bacterium]|nr:trehalose-phosphatase [Chloroflexota bacterium]